MWSTQRWFRPTGLPHPPQFSGSVWVSTHDALDGAVVVGAKGHVDGDAPLRQLSLGQDGAAARPVAAMTDIGVASPSAQGQAMISTATAFTNP